MGIGGLVGVTTIAGAVLMNTTGGVYSGINKASAVISDSKTSVASVKVEDACTISRYVAEGEEESDAVKNITVGTSAEIPRTMKIICNDPNGFDIYAVAYSGTPEDIYNKREGATYGNTDMVVEGSDVVIPTGTTFSGNTSAWGMKVTPSSLSGVYAPIIQNDFDNANFKEIPSTPTIVAAYESDVAVDAGSYFTTTYKTYVAYNQAAGTYVGQVKYTIAHPSETTFKTYMQDLTSSTIATLLPNTGDTAVVVDRRDGQEYLIGKLKDGKYWMLDNLMLGYNTLVETISSDNTNITSTVASSADFSYLNSSVTSGFTSYTDPMINKEYANNTTTSYGSGSGRVGVYYNYCAASARDICTSSNSNNGSTDRDICPKGWRIPTGGSSGEYQALCTATWGSTCSNGMSMAATADNSLQKALSTPLSGTFYGSSQSYLASNGYFWSSTRNDNTNMYYLYVGASNVYPQIGNDRDYGFTVRCLFK